MHWRRKWQPIPVLLPGESQGRGCLVGCRLWGRTESDTTEATYQQQQKPQCYVMVSGRVGLGSITLLALFYFILRNFLFMLYLLCTIIT